MNKFTSEMKNSSFYRVKWYFSILLLMVVVAFSGCGTSLQKPTGLEDENENNQQTTYNKNDNNGEKDFAKNPSNEIESETPSFNANTENDDEENGESDNQTSADPDVKQESNHQVKEDDQSKSTASKTKEQGRAKQKKQETSESSRTKKSDQPKKDQPKEDKPKNETPKNEDGSNNDPPPEKEVSIITHSVVIAAEGSHGQKVCQEKKYKGCPEDGSAEVPILPTVMEIEDEDTVLEALISITKKNKVQMDYRGGKGATAYVQGMGNVYEFDRGQGSGWMYSVNGIFPDRGAGVVPLCDGDVVEWLYTTDLGKDLDADLAPFRRDGKCP